MDTFGCLNQIKNKLNDFYLVNGDTFFEANLQDIKITKSRIASMALTQNLNYSTNRKLSNLTINKNRNISNSKNSKLMNAGLYFFKKEILNYLDGKKQSLENDIIPRLMKKTHMWYSF